MEFALTQLALVGAAFAIAFLFALPGLRLAGRDPGAPPHRYRHLDGMRGLAAVGVVATHVVQYACVFLGNTQPPAVGDHVGILGVQMFFALTAFLFTERALAGDLAPERFYLGRLRRIVPLYAFVVLAALAIALIYTRDTPYPVATTLAEAVGVATYGFWQTPELTFRGMNMLSLVGVAWTLSYEWVFYLLLVPATCLWKAHRGLRWAMLAAVGVLAAREFARQPDFTVWPFFLPGVAAAMLYRRIPALPARLSTLLALSILPAFALVLFLPGFWTPLKLAIAGWIFLAVLVAEPAFLKSALPTYLGRISYSIYLLQYLFLFPVMTWSYGFASVEAKLLACGAVVALVIMAAELSYRFIERPWLTSGGDRSNQPLAARNAPVPGAPEPTFPPRAEQRADVTSQAALARLSHPTRSASRVPHE